jgi:hypothetical protein
MKTLACKFFVFSLLVGTLGTGLTKGQITNEVEFKVPTAFVAGEATLPAGSYTARPWPTDPGVLEISNAAGTLSVLVDTEPTTSDTPAKSTALVFNKYGNQLVLKQIVLANQKAGYTILSKHAEKKVSQAGPPTKQSVPGTAK